MCWSASDIKKDPEGYEDQRCSLIGDFFDMCSFVLFAWSSCFKWLPEMSYNHLAERMGMAPGFCAAPDAQCPLTRELAYGSPSASPQTVSGLTRVLLTRVNHTGSDVRVTAGLVMKPKAFPRQSANSQWWKWKHVYACRWQKREHISRLKMRSILLALRWAGGKNQ